MTRSRSSKASGHPVAMPTDEWLAKFSWKFEPRDADNDHFVVIRNAFMRDKLANRRDGDE